MSTYTSSDALRDLFADLPADVTAALDQALADLLRDPEFLAAANRERVTARGNVPAGVREAERVRNAARCAEYGRRRLEAAR